MILTYSILFISIVLTVVAQLLIKQGVLPLVGEQFSLSNPVGLIFQILKNTYIMSGLFILGATFVIWVWLISKMQLNILYPITVSAQLALIAVSSWIIFKESFGVLQIIGMFVVTFGIFLLLYKG